MPFLYGLDGDERLGIQIPHHERQDFLQFIAGTGDEEAIRFRAASALYAEDLLVEALQHGTAVDVDHALSVAGRLDGAINAAEYTYAMDQFTHEHAENEAKWQTEARRNAGYALAAEMAWEGVSTAATLKSGGLASIVTAAANPAVSSMIDTVFDPGDRPSDFRNYEAHVMTEERDLTKDIERNYLLLSAYEKAGLEPNLEDGSTQARVGSLYDDEGNLRPLSEIGESSDDREALAAAENATRRTWQDQNGWEFDTDYYDKTRDNIDNATWMANSHEESVRPDPPRRSGWGDQDTAGRRLNGDDYVPHPRSRQDYSDPDNLYRNRFVS